MQTQGGVETGKNRPYIKKFKTEAGRYIYDVNSNEILQVSAPVYDLINHMDMTEDAMVAKFGGRHSEEEIRESYRQIQDGRQSGLFDCHRPEIKWRLEVEDVAQSLSSLEQLILEVTRQCNLRCKYCVVSGFYATDQLRRNVMSLSTAKKAVDMFLARTDPKKTTAITFYGGEPLLKFDLIEQTVAYVKQRAPKRKFRFSFTTNGALLHKRNVLSFLVENQFSLLVSLDGPKKVHDRYRVMSNGRGSFDQIVDNLKNIKALAPEYYARHVRFNVVLTPPFDRQEIVEFFYQNPFFEGKHEQIRFSLMNDEDTDFYRKFGQDKRDLPQSIQTLKKSYSEALVQGNSDSLKLENDLFIKEFNSIAFRPGHRLRGFQGPVGQCLPGKRRLFVDTSGKLHMCEKADTFVIGDVDRGLDERKIHQFMVDYAGFFKECNSCWALRLCHKCFVGIDERFDKEKKKDMCKAKKRTLEHNLVNYCTILERNPKAFDVFKKYQFQ